MQSTWQQVLDAARGWMNDTAVPGGANWPNARLQVHAATGYRKMFDALAGIANNRVRHTVYFQLPKYTTIWVPQSPTNIVTEISEPELLSERPAITTGAIATTADISPIKVTTVNPHGLATNATEVIIDQVAGTFAPWGRFYPTVIDPLNFTLNGSVSDGNAGTGGFFSTSGMKFVDMREQPPITNQTASSRDIDSSLLTWWWENNALNFIGATQDTQVRMIYLASGTAPTDPSTVIMVDNCLNLLGAAAAGFALGSVGFPQRSRELLELAFGPTLQADGSAGFLRDLLAPAVMEMQREPIVPRNFRDADYSTTFLID
jgi:hypothetical protein